VGCTGCKAVVEMMVMAVVVVVAMAAVERAGVWSASMVARGASNSSDPSSGERLV
jgi:hypothetical protein